MYARKLYRYGVSAVAIINLGSIFFAASVTYFCSFLVYAFFQDICIGWQFADILYYDDHEQSVRVDLNLANDVLEQADGEGEPLNVVSDSTTSSESEGDIDSYDDDDDVFGETYEEGFAVNV